MTRCTNAAEPFWDWVEAETGSLYESFSERNYFCSQWVDDGAAEFNAFWQNTPKLSD